MRDGWELLRFSDVLRLDVHRVPVTEGKLFPIVGVLNYGRGLLYRDPVSLNSTSYRELNLVQPNHLIYSKLKAFEGAITVAPPDLPASYASGEFPTFSTTGRALPGFLRLLTQKPDLWDAMASLSKGLGGRRERLNPLDLLNLQVRVPPISDQRRIVDLIAALDDTVAAAEDSRVALARMLAARRDLAFTGNGTRSADQMFDITIGLQRSPARADGPHQTPYLRSANVTSGRLRLDDVKTMSFEPGQQMKYRLMRGDVLVSEGSASADAVGAPAQYRGELPDPLCFQNTLLRYRAIPGVTTPEFTFHWCSWAYESGVFRDSANGTNIKHIGSGGAAVMRVAHVPFAAQPELTAELDAAQDAVGAAGHLRDALRSLRSHLLTDLLSGDHEIPESYDELLGEAS